MARMISDLAKLPLFGTVVMMAGGLALLAASEPVLAADLRAPASSAIDDLSHLQSPSATSPEERSVL